MSRLSCFGDRDVALVRRDHEAGVGEVGDLGAAPRRRRAGDALPIVVTAMPEPKSMSRLPSTSSTMPPPALAANTGMVVPTPRDTAALLRSISACDCGPGIAVTR